MPTLYSTLKTGIGFLGSNQTAVNSKTDVKPVLKDMAVFSYAEPNIDSELNLKLSEKDSCSFDSSLVEQIAKKADAIDKYEGFDVEKLEEGEALVTQQSAELEPKSEPSDIDLDKPEGVSTQNQDSEGGVFQTQQASVENSDSELPLNLIEQQQRNQKTLGRTIMMNTISKNSIHLASSSKQYVPREDSPLYTTEKMLFDAQKSIALSTELSEAGKIDTQISDSVHFKGDITFRGTGASIAGVVEGDIVLEGNGVLYLTPSSEVRGNIKARNIIAEGSINGNVECERIIATSTAVLIGDVMYKDVFNPAPGAKVQGSLRSNPNIFTDVEKASTEESRSAVGTI